MKEPIVIHNDEDYERAQERVKELADAAAGSEAEQLALADAMLAWELRLDSAEE